LLCLKSYPAPLVGFTTVMPSLLAACHSWSNNAS